MSHAMFFSEIYIVQYLVQIVMCIMSLSLIVHDEFPKFRASRTFVPYVTLSLLDLRAFAPIPS